MIFQRVYEKIDFKMIYHLNISLTKYIHINIHKMQVHQLTERERNRLQRMWKPSPNDGAILTQSHIMQPYQWNCIPGGYVISATTPDYFLDKKPIASTGKYFIYQANSGTHGVPIRYRSRI